MMLSCIAKWHSRSMILFLRELKSFVVQNGPAEKLCRLTTIPLWSVFTWRFGKLDRGSVREFRTVSERIRGA
jgi:hypothetical protein